MATQDQLDARVAQLKTDHAAAERAQAQAQVRAEHAAAERDKLLARLRDEFSCDSIEDAEKLLANMDHDLAVEVSRVEKELESAGG